MKISIKGILFILLTIVSVIAGLLLRNTEFAQYSIFTFTLAVILLIFGVKELINNSSPNRIYESNIKDILTTYDSVLVKSNSVPALMGRNIIIVESMDDLIDAQLEIRKPICYIKQSESCSFVLLDDKEAYVYVEKLNEGVTSPVDIELNEIRIKSKSAEEMDSEMLREIEKTTIVKLSNQKSYKVSPIRKKTTMKEEEIEII